MSGIGGLQEGRVYRTGMDRQRELISETPGGFVSCAAGENSSGNATAMQPRGKKFFAGYARFSRKFQHFLHTMVPAGAISSWKSTGFGIMILILY
jgi:hypothetical protein